MLNTQYLQGLSNAYAEVCTGGARPRCKNAVRQLTAIYEGRSLQDIVSKREPTEPVRTQYLKVDKKKFDADMKVWRQRNQQAAGKERLKRKGAVPTKAGKRLFEDFLKEAEHYAGKKRPMKNADKIKQVYLSAKALEYDKWLIFVGEMI